MLDLYPISNPAFRFPMSSATPDNNFAGDVRLPPALAARLAEDQETFGHKQTKEELDVELAAAAERRTALEAEKAEQGRKEVEHAKAVAAANAKLGATLAVSSDLESSVAAKRASVERQSAELVVLQERIMAAEERETALKKALDGTL